MKYLNLDKSCQYLWLN